MMKSFLQEHFLTLSPYTQLLILAVVCILLGVALSSIAFKIILSRFSRKDAYISNSIKKHLGGRSRTLFPIILIYSTIGFLAIPPSLFYGIEQTIQVLLIINIGWVLLKLLNVLEDSFFEAYKIRRNKYLKERRIRTQIQFFKKITSILIVVLGIGAILLSFEEVQKWGTTILTSTAVIGVILGFASQKTLANLMAGFQIAFTQPIKIDDTVIVEGEWGVVEEITLTYVVVQVWDRRRLILPINYFINTPFQNWTRNTEDLVGEVRIHVDYRMPVDPLREELQRLVKRNDDWDGKVCKLEVTNASDKTMEIRATISAGDSNRSWDLKCDVREKLINFIQEKYPEHLPKTRATLLNEKQEGKEDQYLGKSGLT